ncbi:MAG: glycine cleavage system protein T [Candidatus Lloydbacteria bacterium RIFCSPHIGHO2_02_FULL_54_17]|uniref:aminomethyltransferase n=1 Tax=Candidatus Lloydbacteria bacterium RIFCSPHIGHO2_02_FULL_54_17 TaxID=1798664 RepID=A0A1G2DDY0_9BACT|nr:MAG: glycine cleavage system protein T [Candidatus Lloydbacteria bacterium RIFCSPHIGHO2_01_FULL_54_11]OGZ11743.1 MAG: glycine cleavage system protein T [Candidatus Lloydbacteria bacterium RIFCSPHIGHO2_02_FULL_54_17]OGZ14272.1 MAG: glycine cleavage system protein T [Candidatus Lloydbacteria bacterium RIFCSPLOWO2_01_FULL_54_18]OGZ16616.1 MAG: glycine cleavage system protein T [Candidatus Lloydbacteria bacterium RIFCSPLOWO2_02_FULL_54_12]
MTTQGTPLNAVHRELGAKMTEFGGWNMPEHYGNIWNEYSAVRTGVGLFDTSHMRAFLVEGKDANAFLQFLTPRNIGIRPWKIQYAVLTNRSGGAVDDCTIYCLSHEEYLVVVNAGNIEKDFAWMTAHAPGFNVVIEKATRYTGMLALQGPRAEKVLAKCVDGGDISSMGKYTFRMGSMGGYVVIISRTGYTGEDGFEILCEPCFLPFFWNMLLTQGAAEGIRACGLGARDLLRLEAWMPLYGHELTEERGPVEADLRFTVNPEKPHFFIGRAALEEVWYLGHRDTLIGLKTEERGAIIRPGCDIATMEGVILGQTTSGAPYPSGTSLGMGYVPRGGNLLPGTPVQVSVHKRWRPAVIALRKFVGTPKEKA